MGTETVSGICKIWPGNYTAMCGKPVSDYGEMCEEHRQQHINEYRTKIHRLYDEIDTLTMKLEKLGASV